MSEYNDVKDASDSHEKLVDFPHLRYIDTKFEISLIGKHDFMRKITWLFIDEIDKRVTF